MPRESLACSPDGGTGAFGQITALILAAIAAGEMWGTKCKSEIEIRFNEIRGQREGLDDAYLRLCWF
jgi:hypothetical protein